MMDRALKERIIGATILVLVVVLVVPVFLDGPPVDGEIISQRVPLPGQADQKTQTIVLNRDRSDPVPAKSDNATSVPTPDPTVRKQAETVSRPPADPKPAVQVPVTKQAEAASTTGMWVVQLGSFSNKENAERLAADLRKQGFAAFLSRLSTSSGQLQRVRIGPQKDRKSAEAMAEKLRRAGHSGQVLPHP
jgi:DedD protein